MGASSQGELFPRRNSRLPRVRLTPLCCHCGLAPVIRKGASCSLCNAATIESWDRHKRAAERIALLDSRPHGLKGSAQEFEDRFGPPAQQLEFPLVRDPWDWLLKEDPLGRPRKPLRRVRLNGKRRHNARKGQP